MASQSTLAVAVLLLLKPKLGMLQIAKEFYTIVILACSLVCLVRRGQCTLHEVANLVDYGASDSCKDNSDTGFKEIFSGGFSLNYIPEHLEVLASAEDVCGNSELFCFPSTLGSFKSDESSSKAAWTGYAATSDVLRKSDSNASWSSDYGVFHLLNGRTASCAGEFSYDISKLMWNHDDECFHASCGRYLAWKKGAEFPADKSSKTEETQFEDSYSPQLVISPSQLDWGENYLYHPSMAFVSLKNTCNESELHVYEPFSSDTQFYPCNSSQFVLGPGEVARLCFVFLPLSLGLSSAEIILQTSVGGFLVQVRGCSADSPYQVSPLMEFDVSPNGWWSKNLSLFNPYEESVQVEEVAVWASVFVGNDSLLAEVICRKNSSYDSADTGIYNNQVMLDVTSVGIESQVMTVRPCSSCSVDQWRSETVVGISLSPNVEGKILGAICMRLHRPLRNKTDVLIIPIDTEISSQVSSRKFGDSVYASVEARWVYDSGDAAVVSIAMRNDASDLVKIVEISEVSEVKLLQIKYSQGLLLFPGTMTHVALVTFRPGSAEDDPLLTSPNCKLKISTNDSISPLILIPCWDIVHIFPRIVSESSLGYEKQSGGIGTRLSEEGYSSGRKEQPVLNKALKKGEADESVLQNWRSHKIPSDLSVLADHEVVFSKVPVGQHHSKLINVENPSQQPVVMQLILNSGEIVHDCRGADGYLQPPSSSSFLRSDLIQPPMYGFSLAAGALTEAYVHPFGKASLGPILFHPSSRCGWNSSALIRNNLSGVEWLTLHGSGGLLSLVLLEDSEPVHRLDFDLDVPLPLNVSSSSFGLNAQVALSGCRKPLSKALRIINSGDLPVTVRRIRISGAECGLDGFAVLNCAGFIVEPREGKELVISYRTDLSAAMVRRDLELSLDTGILVIPMTAIIPSHALHICQQAMFWFWLKKWSYAISLLFFFMFLVLCFLAPQRVVSSLGCLIRGQKSAACLRNAGKSSKVHSRPKGGDFSVTTKSNYVSRSVGEDEESVMRSLARSSAGECRLSNFDSSAKHVNSFKESRSQTVTQSMKRKEIVVPFHQPTKIPTIETSEAEVPQPCNLELEPSEPVQLTVRTGTEKRRKHRRRRGISAGLAGLPEVSSSQSGNSTPSSPLSPMPTFTPNRTSPQPPDREEPTKSWTPFSFSSIVPPRDSDGYCFKPTLERPSALGKTYGRPVLLPSATFPGMDRCVPGLLCPSQSQSPGPIASPHSRAPGSKLLNQKSAHADEVSEDKFTYNIWDNHFSGLHLNSRSHEAALSGSLATENDSNSFFVKGPQTVVTNSRARSVSYVHQGG